MNKIEKALEQIENKQQATDTLEYLTMLKAEMNEREMLPNDFNTYEKLGEMEHSLYRYNSLLNEGLTDDAEKEGKNFFSISQSPDGAIMLKGGISNSHYLWETEAGACEACEELDGQIFNSLDDVPDRPHPNCKCKITLVEDKKEKKNKKENEEPCDCLTEINLIIEQIKQSINNAETYSSNINESIKEVIDNYIKAKSAISIRQDTLYNLNNNYGKHLPDCKNNIDSIYEQIQKQIDDLNNLSKQLILLLNPLLGFVNTCKVFISNYIALLYEAYILKERGMDKFRHAKANCEATQQMGIIGEIYATNLSNLKELYDQYTYVNTHKCTLEEAILDSAQDQTANQMGREKGRLYPDCNCSILLQDLLPKHKK